MLLATACSKKSSDATMSPAEAPTDDLSALELQLSQREEQLRGIGVDAPGRASYQQDATADAAAEASPPITPSAAAAKSAGAPADDEPRGDRCQQVCDISAAICELEQQICGLLPRHRGDDRYQAACDRSVADCRVSTEACNACNAN